MPDPLAALVDDRSTPLRQIAELGDFQPGSITCATRRRGSPACHCAKPNEGKTAFRKFQALTGELVNGNRKICRLWSVEQTAQEKKQRRQSSKKLPAKYRQRSSMMPMAGVDPAFTTLREDARFRKVVRDLGM